MSNVGNSLTRYKTFLHKDGMCKLFTFFSNKWTTLFCFGEPCFCHVSPKCHDLNGFGDWAQVFLRPHEQKNNNRHTLPLCPYVFNDKPTYPMFCKNTLQYVINNKSHTSNIFVNKESIENTLNIE
jgi:hypothetical protein